MRKTYYIDESGNTGDVKIISDNFNGQPIFSLAAVSVANIDSLKKKILELKVEHKVHHNQKLTDSSPIELKTKHLYGKKDKYLLDLIRWLDEEKAEFIVEIVDKRSYLVAILVSLLIFPKYLNNLDQEKLNYLKGVIAEAIYSCVSNHVLIQTHEFIISPSNNALESLFSKIRLEFEAKVHKPGVFEALEMLNISFDDYITDKRDKGDLAYADYSEEVDINKRGEMIAFLCHIPCFCNIYSRINSFNNRKINNVNIVHDNQDHFNELIVLYKEKMEQYRNTEEFKHRKGSDFCLTQKAELEFGDSKGSIALQLADLVAGFSMRFLRDLIDNKEPNESQWKTFRIIQRQNNLHPSLGTLIMCPETVKREIFHYCNHGVTMREALSNLQAQHRNERS